VRFLFVDDFRRGAGQFEGAEGRKADVCYGASVSK
jgi:hypothetical protein